MDQDDTLVEFDVDRKDRPTVEFIKKEPERKIPSEYARYLISRGYAKNESKAYLQLFILTVLCFTLALIIFILTPPKKETSLETPPPVIDFSTDRIRQESL